MCSDCYKEAGSPKIIDNKTKHAAYLIDEIYDKDGCGAGGYAHIVTDDWNLEDHSIDFCLKSVTNRSHDWVSEDGALACIECLKYLKTLTKDERYSAMALSSGFIDNEPGSKMERDAVKAEWIRKLMDSTEFMNHINEDDIKVEISEENPNELNVTLGPNIINLFRPRNLDDA